MLAEEDYRALAETLYLTFIPGMKALILKASKESLENYSDKVDW